MSSLYESPAAMKYSVWVHVLTPILAAMLMNGIIYGTGLRSASSTRTLSSLPPGYIIGAIWAILFGLLGYTHYLLPDGSNASWSIVGFIVFSLLYPIFTGLDARRGLPWNLAALVFAFVVTIFVAMESPTLLYYLLPLLAWVIYVNAVFVSDCATRYS
jgi:tryptophan-rich sensory protein